MGDRMRGWFKSSSSSSGDDTQQKRPFKAKFDGLFAGMPSINDMFNNEDTDDKEDLDQSNPSSRKRKRPAEDFSWFEGERQAIIKSYETIESDMVRKLDNQRKTDPGSVPDNAEAMMKSILKHEMDSEIEETRERMARDRLASYELEQRALVEAKDISGTITDTRVRKLIDEGEAEYERQLAAKLKFDEFLRYEEEAFRKATELSDGSTIQKPDPNSNLDQWALERFEDMASKQEELDVDDTVLDILEENLEVLRERMEKETTKGARQPETMKEWQIYRAIATRLGATVNQDGSITSNSEQGSGITDTEVFQRLQAWKEYNEKEASIREKGGLSRGPKLPFEWQELGSSAGEKLSYKPMDRELRIEARKQINRMSIEALESLLQKSDAARREKLQKEIDYLKRELESKDFLDVDESFLIDPEQEGPVDLSGVFSSDSPGEASKSSSYLQPNADRQLAYADRKPVPSMANIQLPEDSADVELPPVPRPKTAFFDDDDDDSMEVAATDSKLGTMEDQKLAAMYRRAGARTKAEQERIRAGWEDFKRAEAFKRKSSGLDVGDADNAADMTSFSLKYNVSEVMKDGGDFDAEKILSAIGPRPTRSRKPNGGADTGVKTQSSQENQGEPSLQSNIDEREIVASLYRSVSAVGGGRFKDDPEAKAQDEAKFLEFLQMEKQMREKADNTPAESLLSSAPSGLDDDNYAEKVLADLGPRPTPKKKQKIDERYLSDTGAALRDDDEEDDEEDEDVTDDPNLDSYLVDDGTLGDKVVPDWVMREKESKGSTRRSFLKGEEIEDAFPDDEYEKNMRQLAEYERRRAGKSRQMGIDISDVLAPRRDIDSDDYKDYKFNDDIYRGRRFGWGGATYEARKRELMEYNELDVPLLNALLEQKDSVSVTGVSPYMAKINKPFKAFGAIFRLEGVLVDISGLQMKAWSRVAESLELRKPSLEEAKMASVIRPELAVNEIFGWTNDLSEIQSILSNFREVFNEEFDKWAEEEGLASQPESASPQSSPSAKGSLAIGGEVVEQGASEKFEYNDSRMTETELLGFLTQAWTKTADTFNLPWPVHGDIVVAASMEPDLAAMEVFRWTKDPQKADEIASFQRLAVKTLREGKDLSDLENEKRPQRRPPNAEQQHNIDKNALMELHYRAWTAVAASFGFDQPTSDEVLGAFVLNDPVVVVKSGFGWTNDSDEARKIGQAFTETLRGLLGNPTESVYGEYNQQATSSADQTLDASDGSKPSFADVVRIHEAGWSVCCNIHGLDHPSLEQVRLSVNMDPRDFIKKVMRWTDDTATTEKISSTFKDAANEASKSFGISGILRTEEDSKAIEKVPTTLKSGPSFDDVYGAALSAWKAVAYKYGLSVPTTDQVMYAMSVGPEEAIRYGFRWSTKEERVTELLGFYMKEVESQRKKWSNDETKIEPELISLSKEDDCPLVEANYGTEKWIQSLLDVEMECGIISHLSRRQVDVLLEFAGIADLIKPDKRVSGARRDQLRPMATTHHYDSQEMLAASLRLERRPDHCVVVDASPGASVAARSVEMQSVAWIGSYPRYELLSADATVSRLDELTAMNIRRLFGERVYDQPLMDIQKTDLERNRKIKTSFSWDDE
ncbi:hypothetical protein ACA910_016907 [Epithemia clementina (nom. ined.)]